MMSKEDLMVLFKPDTTINSTLLASDATGKSTKHNVSQTVVGGYDLLLQFVSVLTLYCGKSSNADSSFRLLAAQCVGEIGSIDPAANSHHGKLFAGASLRLFHWNDSLAGSEYVSMFNAYLNHSNVAGTVQTRKCNLQSIRHDVQAYGNKSAHVFTMFLLTQFCQHEDAQISQIAYTTLHNIFACCKQDALAALKQSDDVTKAFLVALANCKNTKAKSFKGLPDLKVTGLSEEQLEKKFWLPFAPVSDTRQVCAYCKSSHAIIASGGDIVGASTQDCECKCFGAWICQLSYAFSRTMVKDGVLGCCFALCLLSKEFAEKMFPFLCFDLLFHAPPLSASTSLAAPISTATSPACILAQRFNLVFRFYRPSTGQNLKPQLPGCFLPPLFSALHLFREQHRIILREPKGLASAAPTDSSNLLAQLASFNRYLNYLDLAVAAQQIHCYCTSLMYLEEWNISTPNRSDREGDTFNELLLHAFENVDDSISIDAVHGIVALTNQRKSNTRPDVASSTFQNQHIMKTDLLQELVVAQHERSWVTCMQIYDAFLQGRNFVHEEQGNTFPVGIASSLQQLSCFHVLENYTPDFSTSSAWSSSRSSSELRDKQLEGGTSQSLCIDCVAALVPCIDLWLCFARLAWRCMRWSSTEDSSPLFDSSPTPADFLHTVLFQTLRSLSQISTGGVVHSANSSTHDLPFRLNAARSRLLETDAVALAGPENAPRLFQTIVKLQLLADTQHVFNLVVTKQKQTPLLASAARIAPSRTGSGLVRSGFDLLDKFLRSRMDQLCHRFQLIEPVVALRTVLLEVANEQSLLQDHFYNSIKLARLSNRYDFARQYLTASATRTTTIGIRYQLALKLENAQFQWKQANYQTAINYAKHVLHVCEALMEPHASSGSASGPVNEQLLLQLFIDTSCSLSDWLSTSQIEGSNVIQQILNNAKVKCSNTDSVSQASLTQKLCYHYGRYSDRLFQSLLLKEQSAEHKAAARLIQANALKLQHLEDSVGDPKFKAALTDVNHAGRTQALATHAYVSRLRKEHLLDVESNDAFARGIHDSLESAVANYCNCLIYGDEFDGEIIYRLIALWFNHYSNSPVTDAKERVMKLINEIPSRKFLPLVYQIASRLSLRVVTLPAHIQHFIAQINSLLLRLVRDHPHHVLWQLFALTNEENVARVTHNIAGGIESNANRIKAAKQLIQQCKQSTPYSDLVAAVDKLIECYIDVGNKSYPKSLRELALKDTKLSEMRMRELSLVPPPTLTVPVKLDCNYSRADDITYMIRFDASLKFANSGINKPLIIGMLCSNGIKHTQLLKPSDDLRQDAVMEQLFKLVNTLLRKDQRSETDNLQVRTYNVIPLTPGVGLVEWVQNTLSLADCLTHPNFGAHVRHRPANQQRDYNQCLKYLQEAHIHNKSLLAHRFHEICEDFRPVFHHYFLDMYTSPFEWLARRVTYTRSMAVNSMVGFIVGLGDRHIQNILLDEDSAEVIHIDLGVAFDTGKILKTPELVPFRLTRDLVDAMGVCGVEGVFRRCCEVVLDILRTNHQMLLTVLEVFVHDPLYKWALSAAKIHQLRPLSEVSEDGNTTSQINDTTGPRVKVKEQSQSSKVRSKDTTATMPEDAEPNGTVSQAVDVLLDEDNDDGNANARRAMLAVKNKLLGIEAGEQLSVRGQCSMLINEASDINNLAKMYFGWSAFV